MDPTNSYCGKVSTWHDLLEASKNYPKGVKSLELHALEKKAGQVIFLKDIFFDVLASLENLEELRLSGQHFEENDLKMLGESLLLTKIRKLSLFESHLTENGISSLHFLLPFCGDLQECILLGGESQVKLSQDTIEFKFTEIPIRLYSLFESVFLPWISGPPKHDVKKFKATLEGYNEKMERMLCCYVKNLVESMEYVELSVSPGKLILTPEETTLKVSSSSSNDLVRLFSQCLVKRSSTHRAELWTHEQKVFSADHWRVDLELPMARLPSSSLSMIFDEAALPWIRSHDVMELYITATGTNQSNESDLLEKVTELVSRHSEVCHCAIVTDGEIGKLVLTKEDVVIAESRMCQRMQGLLLCWYKQRRWYVPDANFAIRRSELGDLRNIVSRYSEDQCWSKLVPSTTKKFDLGSLSLVLGDSRHDLIQMTADSILIKCSQVDLSMFKVALLWLKDHFGVSSILIQQNVSNGADKILLSLKNNMLELNYCHLDKENSPVVMILEALLKHHVELKEFEARKLHDDPPRLKFEANAVKLTDLPIRIGLTLSRAWASSHCTTITKFEFSVVSESKSSVSSLVDFVSTKFQSLHTLVICGGLGDHVTFDGWKATIQVMQDPDSLESQLLQFALMKWASSGKSISTSCLWVTAPLRTFLRSFECEKITKLFPKIASLKVNDSSATREDLQQLEGMLSLFSPKLNSFHFNGADSKGSINSYGVGNLELSEESISLTGWWKPFSLEPLRALIISWCLGHLPKEENSIASESSSMGSRVPVEFFHTSILSLKLTKNFLGGQEFSELKKIWNSLVSVETLYLDANEIGIFGEKLLVSLLKSDLCFCQIHVPEPEKIETVLKMGVQLKKLGIENFKIKKCLQTEMPDAHCKVMFIGKTGSGTTTLMNSIKSCLIDAKPATNTHTPPSLTLGAAISRLRNKNTLTFLDLSGPEEYNPIQGVFFSPRRALYILVFSLMETSAELRNQIHRSLGLLETQIEMHSQVTRQHLLPTVMIVGTHVDRILSKEAINCFEEVLKRISFDFKERFIIRQLFHYVDARALRSESFSDLYLDVIYTLEGLLANSKNIPGSYVKLLCFLQEKLDAFTKKRWFPIVRFNDLFAEVLKLFPGVFTEALFFKAIHYASSVNAIMFFPELPDFIFLSPNWIAHDFLGVVLASSERKPYHCDFDEMGNAKASHVVNMLFKSGLKLTNLSEEAFCDIVFRVLQFLKICFPANVEGGRPALQRTYLFPMKIRRLLPVSFFFPPEKMFHFGRRLRFSYLHESLFLHFVGEINRLPLFSAEIKVAFGVLEIHQEKIRCRIDFLGFSNHSNVDIRVISLEDAGQSSKCHKLLLRVQDCIERARFRCCPGVSYVEEVLSHELVNFKNLECCQTYTWTDVFEGGSLKGEKSEDLLGDPGAHVAGKELSVTSRLAQSCMDLLSKWKKLYAKRKSGAEVLESVKSFLDNFLKKKTHMHKLCYELRQLNPNAATRIIDELIHVNQNFQLRIEELEKLLSATQTKLQGTHQAQLAIFEEIEKERDSSNVLEERVAGLENDGEKRDRQIDALNDQLASHQNLLADTQTKLQGIQHAHLALFDDIEKERDLSNGLEERMAVLEEFVYDLKRIQEEIRRERLEPPRTDESGVNEESAEMVD